jgi:hypothetical protein
MLRVHGMLMLMLTLARHGDAGASRQLPGSFQAASRQVLAASRQILGSF